MVFKDLVTFLFYFFKQRVVNKYLTIICLCKQESGGIETLSNLNIGRSIFLMFLKNKIEWVLFEQKHFSKFIQINKK